MTKTGAKKRVMGATHKLMETTAFENISVKMICEAAGVSRKSFYVYYKDKYDVLAQTFIEDSIVTVHALRKYKLGSTATVTGMYRSMLEKKSFYQNAIHIQGIHSLQNIMTQEIQAMNMKMLKTHTYDDVDKEHISYYFAASQAMLLLKWISEGMVVSPERMAYYFDILECSAMYPILIQENAT